MSAAAVGREPIEAGPATGAAAAGGSADGGPPQPVLLGVRHHGPGSARAVRAALDQYEPRVVLIEGPPEADALVALAAEEGMRPPVALLAHVLDDPARAAFWPLAEFSPEWVAIRWALAHDVPVRFIDLPAAHTLAFSDSDSDSDSGSGSDSGNDSGNDVVGAAPATGDAPDGADNRPDGYRGAAPDDASADPSRIAPSRNDSSRTDTLRIDPLAVLAETAGYDDPERWWEDVVEHRSGSTVAGPTGAADALAPFAALADAMGALRTAYGHGGHGRDLVREAHMRLRLREARREFDDRVAVVCGAWHVPALAERSTVGADRQSLKGLPKVKAELTWVPWTHRRLSRYSGYGAGISSPGWYGHLFSAPDRPIERWMTKVAGLFRDEDQPVSSAHVIESVRLADTLAAMRGRPLAGLTECTDAVRAVMCDGSDVPLSLIEDRLVVGDVLGEVPESAPAVPLQRDLARTQRTLRLKPEAMERELDLDLRKPTDAGRSRLLHRLRLLGIDWGAPARSRGSTGTFRETWQLRWEPELAVRVAEAGVWGTTVLSAATAKAASQAAAAPSLAEVTGLAEQCLLAELSDALPVVMRVLADRAALDTEVGHLAQALPALVRSVRYGDVRGTDAAALAEVAAGLAQRVCVGLPPACVGLDADGAAEMRGHLDAAHQAVGLLAQTPSRAASGAASGEPPGVSRGAARGEPEGQSAVGASSGPDGKPAVDASSGPEGQSAVAGQEPADPEASNNSRATGGLRDRWAAMLRVLAIRDAVPGLLRGRATRILLDDGRLADGDAALLMGLALSPGTAPAEAAQWIEGFVGGAGGMLLVHDERLLALVDGWLTGVTGDAFLDVLPLLRRTFSAYEPGVRRTVGERVRRGPVSGGDRPGAASASLAVPGFGRGIDPDRSAAVLPTLRALLGLEEHEMAGVTG
ncbi:DUF5682 family protein [Streptomyces sp. H27-D2]|uniref:DUF5682 family protein n=1 Tax=Streptomyces sp. H27-D2 TaxID=3046304 RepID=UPI002DB5C5F9|nr:DUF5682 family protein [Streptomyces sp. H27-D2]MEC4015987.1 DUF5682 family protein [Streptomyces sp. H27-D2]